MKYVKRIKKVVVELQEANSLFAFDNRGDLVTKDDIEKWGMEAPEDVVLAGEEAIKEYIRVRAYEAGAWIFG